MYSEDAVQHAAQHLILMGTVRRGEEPVRILRDENKQIQLRHRLDAVGLELVESHATDSYGIRAKPTYWTHEFQEATNNKGLGKDAFAALCLFWCKLVLPYRIQIDRQEVQGQLSFDAKKNRSNILDNPPKVQIDSVYAEFKDQLGGKSAFTTLVGRLVSLGFLRRAGKGIVTVGPNLDTALDWSVMKDFIESELAEVKARTEAIPLAENTVPSEILDLLSVASEPLSIAEIAENMRIDQDACKTAIGELRAEGLVNKVSDKRGAKYETRMDDEEE